MASSIDQRYAFVAAHPGPITYLTSTFLHGGWWAAMHELGASEAARRIRAGALSPSNPVAACLKRVRVQE